MEQVDSSAMCPSNSVYLLTSYMGVSNEGLNLQVINVINSNLTEYMKQSIQVCRGKRQQFLTTGKESVKPLLKTQIGRLKFYSSNSSSTSSNNFV